MGTTEESFHLVGNVPEEIDKLNSLVTGAAILTAVAFNILSVHHGWNKFRTIRNKVTAMLRNHF